MKKSNQLIMGIGHRIKSLANPDQRVGAPSPVSEGVLASSGMPGGDHQGFRQEELQLNARS